MMYNYVLLVAFLMIFMIVFGIADFIHWLVMKLKEPKRIIIDRYYQGKL